MVETAKTGSDFAVRVVRIDGSSSKTYGHVPGCFDDGVFGAALQSLQFVPGPQVPRLRELLPGAGVEPLRRLHRRGGPHAADPRREALPHPQLVARRHAPRRTRASTNTGLSCKGCPGSIWIADADGANARLLVPGSEASLESELSPSWSPDGTRILFTRASPAEAPSLFVVPAAGGTPTNLNISGYYASWGPARIAWIDIGTNPTSIWTAKPDGTGRQKISEGQVSSPAWSPDGRLAYLDGAATAVIVNGASTQKVQLPFAEATSLAWSPDGTRFVVGARAAGARCPGHLHAPDRRNRRQAPDVGLRRRLAELALRGARVMPRPSRFDS